MPIVRGYWIAYTHRVSNELIFVFHLLPNTWVRVRGSMKIIKFYDYYFAKNEPTMFYVFVPFTSYLLSTLGEPICVCVCLCA